MAITDQTLELQNGMRIELDERVDRVTGNLIRGWASAWDNLSSQWTQALNQVLSGIDDGKWPSQSQIMRMQRVLTALSSTRAQLDRLSRETGVMVTDTIPGLVNDASRWEALMIASNYPPQAGELSRIVLSLNDVDPMALSAIVKQTADAVAVYTGRLPAGVEAILRELLIEGVAVGRNPREVAARMLGRIENVFNMGLSRAMTIARTEMLDAHRAAALERDKANAAILQGWEWVAALDTRTCLSCWSMHGQRFSVDVPGPEDHPQGRCARVPVTRTWAELGYKVPEPADPVPNSQELFNSLPRDEQLAIMGQARLDLLNSGTINWSDLSTYKPNEDWRGSYVVTPLKDLVR